MTDLDTRPPKRPSKIGDVLAGIGATAVIVAALFAFVGMLSLLPEGWVEGFSKLIRVLFFYLGMFLAARWLWRKARR
jgi:hypothetical protein